MLNEKTKVQHQHEEERQAGLQWNFFRLQRRNAFYQFLEYEVEKKRIAHFDHQVKMVLIDKYQIFLKKVMAAEIVIDFRVFLSDGSVIYQDVKGFPSDKAKLQRKIFEWRYGVPLQWITLSDIDGGWIDYDELKKRRSKRKREGNND